MHNTFHSIRSALAALVLLAHLGAGAASACTTRGCDMPTPPAGTIAAACCCEVGCGGLVAAEKVSLPSEVTVSSPGVITSVPVSILPVATRPSVVVPTQERPRPHLHLFQLHQSYRI